MGTNMTTLSRIIKSGQLPDNLPYTARADLHRYMSRRSQYNELQRAVARVYKRGLIKPFGNYERGDTIVQIGLNVFSVTASKFLPKSVQQPEKIKEFLEHRRYALRNHLSAYLPRYNVEDVTPVLNWKHARLFFKRISSSKYGRKLHVSLPTTMIHERKWNTDDFIVAKKHPDYQDLGDGIKLCRVSGWWKRDIKEGENPLQEAFMAYNSAEATHSITQTENGAVNGLKTRLTNKVLKAIS